MNIDLHSHSTNSDGTWSVEQILREAERKGVRALCISDHDNFRGSLEAYRINDGLFSGYLVPGIEISAKFEDFKIHMLAYLPTFDIPETHELLRNLEKILNSRVWRMEKMVEKANEMGFEITFEEVLKEVEFGSGSTKQPMDVISRPHLARAMVKKGLFANTDEVFDKYLNDSGPMYVERFTLKLKEWIDLVHSLGGLAVWAHPFHGHKSSTESFEFYAPRIASHGIDGIELYYNYKKKYVVDEDFLEHNTPLLIKLIKENDLLITAGGDFHGENNGCLGEMDLPEADWDRFVSALKPYFLN